MSGDPYIKENERLEAEVARLRADLDTVELGFAAVRHDNARLRAALEWLQSRGRLGLDVHERIAKALAKEGK